MNGTQNNLLLIVRRTPDNNIRECVCLLKAEKVIHYYYCISSKGKEIDGGDTEMGEASSYFRMSEMIR
jgi:hypothetical protein